MAITTAGWVGQALTTAGWAATAAVLAALMWQSLRVGPPTLPPTLPPSTPPPLPAFARTADGLALLQPAELKPFTGHEGRSIFLAILGDVFNVSTGARHYAPGHAYAHFAGCDSSRAFATGPDDGRGLTDDLSGLNDEELRSVGGWHEFFVNHENYTRVGRVSGRYYDADGGALEQFPWARLRAAEQAEEQRKQEYPGCNSKWTQATGSEVWCTAKSGGVSRDWVGVPRLLAAAEGSTQKERCACVPFERAQQPHLRAYEGCEPQAERCRVPKRGK
eukprot:Transcript_24603.p1 GENE.Transcript_24603~~Transcript_24603.p1  ORF type:complete len:303 (-),score=88.93 Transcript_24603:67-894(-)